ncbi:MAG: Jag N-terminal domain-containing protein [Anaerolineae bacterium]|jgi:spoIIIJ-associated protein|nr:Jag N-terminal domain-containing protein [Anaerolineae bacterium]
MGSDDSVVVTAPSVEEAIIVGLTRLVATRDEVDIEVLDEGSRGFLGIGAREARVRLERSAHEVVPPGVAVTPAVGAGVSPAAVASPAAAEPGTVEVVSATGGTVAARPLGPSPIDTSRTEVPRRQSQPAAKPAPREPKHTESYEAPKPKRGVRPSTKRDEPGAGQDLDREGLTRLAEDTMSHMLLGLEVEASVEWVDEDRPTIWISLTGRDADALVGPRARNLHALQYLVRALMYHRSDGSYNVVVDADGYRRRQRRSLEMMAQAKADQAVAEGRMVRLRAMPPHERRIVHIILRDDDRVSTESVGKGRDRAVTIVPRMTSEPK